MIRSMQFADIEISGFVGPYHGQSCAPCKIRAM